MEGSQAIRTKVYGTIKGEQRITIRHKYYAVSRNKNGTFKTQRKWSPKAPLKKHQYVEKYQESKTGKEAKEKIVKDIKEDIWDEYKVKSP